MKKYFLLFIIALIIPLGVNATSSSTAVSDNMTYDQCVNFQDTMLSSNSYGYISHCIRAQCYGGTYYTSAYITDRLVKCTNGNANPYYISYSDGCKQYVGSCDPTFTTKYCGMIVYFDCGKTSSGTTYVEPTTAAPVIEPPVVTTKKPVTKPKKPVTTAPSTTTTTSTTTPVKDGNTYLKTLSLSVGEIEFNKETTNYEITIPEGTTSVEVKAEAESSVSGVSVANNTAIDISVPIMVTVMAENGDSKVYTIAMKVAGPTLDDNALLKTLIIKDYKLNFDPEVFSYDLKIAKDLNVLEISVETSSEKSTYVIKGNSNLKNKSKISIEVTSESGAKEEYLINIKKSTNLPIIIIIILVIGVAGYFGFKLVKKFVPHKEDENYDYE